LTRPTYDDVRLDRDSSYTTCEICHKTRRDQDSCYTTRPRPRLVLRRRETRPRLVLRRPARRLMALIKSELNPASSAHGATLNTTPYNQKINTCAQANNTTAHVHQAWLLLGLGCSHINTAFSTSVCFRVTSPYMTDGQTHKPVGDVARDAASLVTADIRSALATAVLRTAVIDS